MAKGPIQDNIMCFVSVIMPVRNEGAYIQRSLDAVLAQDYPAGRMEIIVVDGMSDDGTREYIRAQQANHPHLHLLDNPRRIVPPGLNLGIQRAKGDIIVRVDGHCEIAPDYVRRCVEHLQAEHEGIGAVDAVGGPIETVGETTAAAAIALAMSSWFGVGGSAFRTVKDRPLLVETVAFPAYPRRTIRRVGLFDEELVRNQDDEYNYRLLKNDGKILLSPDIRSRYYSRSSFRSLWRQYYQYGFWKVRVMQKHPRQMRWRQFVPLAFVVSLALSLVLALVLPAARWLFFAVVVAYLAADGVASLALGRRQGWHYTPLLLLIHPILHVSYGLGFLSGLAHFAPRWAEQGGDRWQAAEIAERVGD